MTMTTNPRELEVGDTVMVYDMEATIVSKDASFSKHNFPVYEIQYAGGGGSSIGWWSVNDGGSLILKEEKKAKKKKAKGIVADYVCFDEMADWLEKHRNDGLKLTAEQSNLLHDIYVKPTEKVTEEKSPRETLLLGAVEAVTKQRNNQYGPPTQDFDRTAALWSILFEGKGEDPFEAHDVAIALIALKLSRLTWNPYNQDSWLDVAGYAGCGWECVINTLEES